MWTVKNQANFLDCKVLLADPGWVYTEGTLIHLKGPRRRARSLGVARGGPN